MRAVKTYCAKTVYKGRMLARNIVCTFVVALRPPPPNILRRGVRLISGLTARPRVKHR